MLRRLGRDDRDGNRRLLAAHGQAGVAPEGFRDAEFAAQPVGGIDDLRPGRASGFSDSSAAAAPACISSSIESRITVPLSVRCVSASADLRPAPSLPLAFRLLVRPHWRFWFGSVLAPIRLTPFGSHYRILFRIRTWFVGILVGSVFRPLGVGIHRIGGDRSCRREQLFQAFAGRGLPPFQALDAERHFLRALDLPQGEREVAALADEVASIPRRQSRIRPRFRGSGRCRCGRSSPAGAAGPSRSAPPLPPPRAARIPHAGRRSAKDRSHRLRR